MSDDPLKKPITVIVATIGILIVAVTGVLLSNFYSKVTDPGEVDLVTEFDPSRYPAPAAGVPGAKKYTQNCENVLFRTTKSGVRYVRQANASVLIGAERRGEFGYYKIEYGALVPIDSTGLDRYDKAKLKYALYNCEGPFTPSGADF